MTKRDVVGLVGLLVGLVACGPTYEKPTGFEYYLDTPEGKAATARYSLPRDSARWVKREDGSRCFSEPGKSPICLTAEQWANPKALGPAN